jgi:hypothetical protein
MTDKRNFEIEQILHCQSEIRNLELDMRWHRGINQDGARASRQFNLKFVISGFEMQDLSDFKISSMPSLLDRDHFVQHR